MLIFHSGLSRDFDGPGERLVFYLKGCNFHCDWCGSPESISKNTQLLYYPERNRDILCRNCPHQAYADAGKLQRSICSGCRTFDCVKIWRNPAFELAGTTVTAEEICRQILEMRDFIDGVTFGGGEPSLQIKELLDCIALLKKHRIHTAVESNASTVGFPRLIGNVDLLYADLKTLDPATAKKRMDADISQVAENLRLAAERQTDFILRIPVIRDVNTSFEAQKVLTDFCSRLNKLRKNSPLEVELLRQHHLGAPKYDALDMPYKLRNTQTASPEDVSKLAEKLDRCGIKTRTFI